MDKSFSLLKKVSTSVATVLLLTTSLQGFSASSIGSVKTVGNLLQNSSAARNVKASSNEEAKAVYQKALDLYEQAKQSTDDEQTKSLLDQAVKNMIKAGKMIQGDPSGSDKSKADYENRLASINALMTAQSAVADEKHDDAASGLKSEVNALVAKAQKQYDNHDYQGGRATLDQAYALVKGSISDMRSGDTLVNSLNFETPKDEYDYYVTKTSSQLTALNMFKEKKPNKARMIDGITKSAGKLIAEAGELADAGDHENAIPLMEKALTRLQSGLMMALN